MVGENKLLRSIPHCAESNTEIQMRANSVAKGCQHYAAWNISTQKGRLELLGIHKSQGQPVLSSVVADLRYATAMFFGVHLGSKKYKLHL